LVIDLGYISLFNIPIYQKSKWGRWTYTRTGEGHPGTTVIYQIYKFLSVYLCNKTLLMAKIIIHFTLLL